MAVGLQVCSLGEALAVLPDVVARERPSLWRLPVDIIPSTPVVAITRKNLGTRGKAELIVEAVQAVVAEKRLV
jgi:DNA-binding transcriptional LysR family regulator